MKSKIFLKIILSVGFMLILGLDLPMLVHGESLNVSNHIKTTTTTQKAAPFAPSDGRTEVQFPECDPAFSPIGLLLVRFPDGATARGTGFLIANNVVATTAHNLYSAEHGGYVDRITFTPSSGAEGHTPFGVAYGLNRIVPDQYIQENESPDFDYGAIQIDTPLGTDFYANHFDLRVPNPVGIYGISGRIAGYPTQTHGAATDLMWFDTGALWVRDDDYRRLYYNMTTSEGQSGSPIVLENDSRYAIGIHTHGSAEGTNWNSGVLFTQEVYDFLTRAFSN